MLPVDGSVTVAVSSMIETEIDVEVVVIEAETTTVEAGAVVVTDVVAVTVLLNADQSSRISLMMSLSC